MRELIRLPRARRDERGVTAIFIALTMTIMLAGLGLSVDVGNAAYLGNKAQDTADSAAKQIAYECLKNAASAGCTQSTAQARSAATAAMGSDADDATVTAAAAGPSGVRVTIDKNVKTPLLSFVGIDQKGVSGAATATWNNYPVSGTPVLPLGVSYCTWKNYSGQAGTTSEANSANHVSIRTDLLQSLRNMLAPLLSTMSVFRLDSIMNMLGTSATDTCSDVDGRQLLTFKGGLWLTGENVVTSTLTGTYSDLGSCRLRIGNDLNTFLGGAESAAFIPTACAAKFGPGKEVAVGKTILLPIYKPSSSTQNTLGLKASACAGSFGSAIGSLTCIEVPPKIGVKVVGYAPFMVTGWNYPNTPSGYTDPAVACPTTRWSLDPYALVNQTFTFLERLLNSVSSLLSTLLGLGQLTASLSCNGLHGYFTKSIVKDPNVTYGPSGANLGAAAVKLTD